MNVAGAVRIDADQAEQIHRLAGGGTRRDEIAAQLGVLPHVVRNVLLGRTVGKPVAPASLAERWKADCMDPGEWEVWQDTNRRLAHGVQVSRPCADCTLGFAAEMRAVGRCNGEPGALTYDNEPEDPEEEEQVTRPEGVKPPTGKPTAKQAEAWELVVGGLTQGEAAARLGLTQSGIQGRLLGYMAAMGIDGRMPGYVVDQPVSTLSTGKPDNEPTEPAVSLQPEPADVTPLAAGDDPVTPWAGVPMVESVHTIESHELLVRSSSSDQATQVSTSPNPAQTIPITDPIDTPAGAELLIRYIGTLIGRLERRDPALDGSDGQCLMDRIERLLGVAP